MGTKESVCIRKEFNSQRIGLGHQHGRRFIVLGHQYVRRDVMWKHFLIKKNGKRWTFSRVQFNITKWQPPAVIFFVILACARVLLWRLAIALEQMLPAGEVYFRPVMSTNSQRKPRGGVDFLQRSTVFWILFFEFHKVC